jgi:hypothetical protein
VRDDWLLEGRAFVQARRAGEDPTPAVPADQLWTEPGATAALMLRPGTCVIRLYDDGGSLRRTPDVRVAAP